jgi:hypothetical protein
MFNNFGFRYLLLFLSLLVFGCRPANKSTSAYLTQTPSFIREEPSGILIIKSFGSGYTQAECIENAMYNGIREVIFNGIKGSSDQRPLIGGANPEMQYSAYFSSFFSKNGPYTNFVSTSNRGNIDKNDRFEVSSASTQLGRRSVTSRRSERLSIGVELVIKKGDLSKEINTVLLKN